MITECPHCKSENTAKMGLTWRGGKRVQRYRCNTCGKTFVEGANRAGKNRGLASVASLTDLAVAVKVAQLKKHITFDETVLYYAYIACELIETLKPYGLSAAEIFPSTPPDAPGCPYTPYSLLPR